MYLHIYFLLYLIFFHSCCCFAYKHWWSEKSTGKLFKCRINLTKINNRDGCSTLSFHISQTEEDTCVYSAVVFTMIKTGSGRLKAAEKGRIYTAMKAVGLNQWVTSSVWHLMVLYDVAEVCLFRVNTFVICGYQLILYRLYCT